MNPMGTRRTGGAGIEMDGDVSMGEYDAEMNGGSGSMYYSQEHATGSYEQVGVYGNHNAPGGAYCTSHAFHLALPVPQLTRACSLKQMTRTSALQPRLNPPHKTSTLLRTDPIRPTTTTSGPTRPTKSRWDR